MSKRTRSWPWFLVPTSMVTALVVAITILAVVAGSVLG